VEAGVDLRRVAGRRQPGATVAARTVPVAVVRRPMIV
jgi:hypothetical protein